MRIAVVAASLDILGGQGVQAQALVQSLREDGVEADLIPINPRFPFGMRWMRRLPYALRACMAALTQLHVSLEEAAESLGATKARTVRRVVVPLMAGGILAGFVTSFITAAVELSATIVLSASAETAPMSYGIYLYMQSIAGRGPGAALGVIAVAIVGLGTYFSYRLTNRSDAWTR